MPGHVDVGPGRGPQPVPHLGAPQDHRFPFHLEAGFKMLATILAIFCTRWRTERLSQVCVLNLPLASTSEEAALPWRGARTLGTP